MARPKHKFQWQASFDHGGHKIYVQGDYLGASGESMLRGSIRQNDYGRAEIAMLGNTVRLVKIDGNTKFNRDKGMSGADIPSPYDSELELTLAERLLYLITTAFAPHIAEQYEDAFGIYYDEEVMRKMYEGPVLGEDPTESAESLGGTGLIGSRAEEQT